MVNGELITDEASNGSGLMASAGEVNGELKQVDALFEWMWFHLKDIIKVFFIETNLDYPLKTIES